MEFIAEIFEVERSRAKRLTGELFEQFALRPYAAEQIEHLSHGTRQRLAIASALLHDPKVIIIDEPMIGLDPVHMRVVKEERKTRSKAGVTIFMSTHLLTSPKNSPTASASFTAANFRPLAPCRTCAPARPAAPSNSNRSS